MDSIERAGGRAWQRLFVSIARYSTYVEGRQAAARAAGRTSTREDRGEAGAGGRRLKERRSCKRNLVFYVASCRHCSAGQPLTLYSIPKQQVDDNALRLRRMATRRVKHSMEEHKGTYYILGLTRENFCQLSKLC